MLCEKRAFQFCYLIDSGADVSLIKHSVVKVLSARMVLEKNLSTFSGLGSNNIQSLGVCELIVVLKTVTLEIKFVVVPDAVIPCDIDLIIGWDVMSRPSLSVSKHKHGLELHPDLRTSSKVLFVRSTTKVMINQPELNSELRLQLEQLLTRYKNKTPNYITTGKMQIRLKDDIPVAYHPRRLAYQERLQVKSIVGELLKDNVIRKSYSSYASPVVLVKKKNGDTRMCVDYREINKKVVKERYPLPHIQDQINSLCHAKYFTTLDMKSGFHQMEIEEDSKPITAFITPDGHYEYNRMPFGYVNAPAIYQRAIDKALGNLKGTMAFVYLDDVLVPSVSIDEGLTNLEKVLSALAIGGFSLNYQKCVFFSKETEYLGVILSEGSIRPSVHKIKALTQSFPPCDVKGVRQFMGLAGYFRRFIKNFATITAPITTLLRKHHKFEWTKECENARQFIICKLTSAPILRIYNPDNKCQLHTDASSIGIGAALLQEENDVVLPVAYYSRRTTDYESKYHSYDLETLAIVESIEHFRVYLYGVHFTVFTDCNSVRATALKKALHPRVARWWIKLQDYDFTIEYRPGNKMGHVDYLSRNPTYDDACELKVCVLKTVNINKISKIKTIREFQSSDALCCEILNNPNSDLNLQVINGVVVTKTEKPKCFVPIAARLLTMRLYHDESSHIGWEKGIKKMQEDLYWPKMSKCFKKYVKNCRSCVLGKSHTGRRAGLWQHGEQPSDILETWHIDHAGPLVKSKGYTHILVIIDAFSKYCRLQPIPRKTSEDSICALLAVFEELGRPKRIIADRAAAFTSSLFRNCLSEQNVEIHHIATGVPRGNAKVERLMRTVFNLLRATLNVEKEKNWPSALAAIEDNLNSTVHATTGQVPAVLQLGRNPRLMATQNYLTDVTSLTNTLVDPEKAVVEARVRMENDIKTQARKFNASRYCSESFQPGELVAVEDSQVAGGGKLKAKFKGPYTVWKILPNQRYVLTKKGKRTTVAAHEQLRRWPSTVLSPKQ